MLMNKITLLAVLATSLLPTRSYASVDITDETFPDYYFQSYVLSTFDKDKDETLSDAEIAAATTIKANSKKIASLKGIEYLTALTSLSATNNHIGRLEQKHRIDHCELEHQQTHRNRLEWLKKTANA